MDAGPIPLSAPDIVEADRQAVLEVLKTPRLSIGPHTRGFEAAVAARARRRHGVAVNSGTSGLHLCVRDDQLRLQRHEQSGGQPIRTIPCEDIGVLVIEHPRTTFSQSVFDGTRGSQGARLRPPVLKTDIRKQPPGSSCSVLTWQLNL